MVCWGGQRKMEHRRLLRAGRPQGRDHVQVQVLLNRMNLTDARPPHEAVQGLSLALGEFDGFVESVWDVLPGGLVVGAVFWQDARALKRFRHSELYARFRLSPSSEGVVDRNFPLGAAASVSAARSVL